MPYWLFLVPEIAFLWLFLGLEITNNLDFTIEYTEGIVCIFRYAIPHLNRLPPLNVTCLNIMSAKHFMCTKLFVVITGKSNIRRNIILLYMPKWTILILKHLSDFPTKSHCTYAFHFRDLFGCGNINIFWLWFYNHRFHRDKFCLDVLPCLMLYHVNIVAC